MGINERIEYIDRAKGFGIILVVLGHMAVSHEWCTFITTFHIPLFFFIGGYLFDSGKHKSGREFAVRKINRIVVPYFLYSLISFCASCGRTLIGQYEINMKDVMTQFIIKGTIESNLPLWFMRSFLVVEIIFFLFTKISKRSSYIVLMLSCCLFVSFALIQDTSLPISRTVNGVFFYGLGYLFRTYKIDLRCVSKRVCFLCCVTFFVMQAVFSYFILINSYTINIASRDHVILFVLCGISGILASLFLVIAIGSNMILEYFGRNSLIIMCTHILIKDVISVVVTIGFGVSKKYITDLSNIKGIVLTLVVLAIQAPVIEFINRFCPILAGKGIYNKKEVQ